MSIERVYLVSHKGVDSLGAIDVAFDSREKAEAYANRFKTNNQPNITEVILNPPYLIDKGQDCFLVELNSEDPQDVECYISNTLANTAQALAGDVFFDRESAELRIIYPVLAPSEEEAIAMVLKRGVV